MTMAQEPKKGGFKKVDAYAIAAAMLAVAVWFQWTWVKQSARPATDWFEVETLNIPDFIAGNTPSIAYQRVIRKSFAGSFKIAIIRAAPGDIGAITCLNSKKLDYVAGRELPGVVDFAWLFGDAEWPACAAKLREGEFQARISWDIEVPGLPVKNYMKLSNIFRVFPEGAQLYAPATE